MGWHNNGIVAILSCFLVVWYLVGPLIPRNSGFSLRFAYDLLGLFYTFQVKCMSSLLSEMHDVSAFTFTPRTMGKRCEFSCVLSSHCSFVCGLCSPKLAPFIDYLLSLTRAIEKRREGGASGDDTTALARRVKHLLAEVDVYDRARCLSKFFQLKETL